MTRQEISCYYPLEMDDNADAAAKLERLQAIWKRAGKRGGKAKWKRMTQAEREAHMERMRAARRVKG